MFYVFLYFYINVIKLETIFLLDFFNGLKILLT